MNPTYGMSINTHDRTHRVDLGNPLTEMLDAREFDLSITINDQPVIVFHSARVEVYAGVEQLAEMLRRANEFSRLAASASDAVMCSTPFHSAWEFDRPDVDAERLHIELREALGISEEDWRESDRR